MSLHVSNFESLAGTIADVHQRLQSEAVKAVKTVIWCSTVPIPRWCGQRLHNFAPLSLILCDETCRFLKAQMAEERAAEVAENLESCI